MLGLTTVYVVTAGLLEDTVTDETLGLISITPAEVVAVNQEEKAEGLVPSVSNTLNS